MNRFVGRDLELRAPIFILDDWINNNYKKNSFFVALFVNNYRYKYICRQTNTYFLEVRLVTA